MLTELQTLWRDTWFGFVNYKTETETETETKKQKEMPILIYRMV